MLTPPIPQWVPFVPRGGAPRSPRHPQQKAANPLAEESGGACSCLLDRSALMVASHQSHFADRQVRTRNAAIAYGSQRSRDSVRGCTSKLGLDLCQVTTRSVPLAARGRISVYTGACSSGTSRKPLRIMRSTGSHLKKPPLYSVIRMAWMARIAIIQNTNSAANALRCQWQGVSSLSSIP